MVGLPLSGYNIRNQSIIFDSGSWGQFIDGTLSSKKPQFTDPHHIIGSIIRLNYEALNISMRCFDNSRRETILDGRECYTKPAVRFANSGWAPLLNLHVHSKRTEHYISKKCIC